MKTSSPGEMGPASKLAALRIPAAEMTGFFGKGAHGLRALPRLRGLGVLITKSEALLSVSVHPFEWRRIAVTLFSAGAGWDHPTGWGTPHNTDTFINNLVTIRTSP